MTVQAGDTFLGDPRELRAQTPHLWVVLEVYRSDGADCVLAVMVSATSKPVARDLSCVLQPGDHPFIRHETYIAYQWVGDYPLDATEGMKHLEPLKPEILKRLRQGLHRSKVAPQRFKRLVPDQ